MDESGTVESTKNHVNFPVDTPQDWGSREGEDGIPGPVGSSSKRDRFGTDLGGKYFGRVGP